MTRVYIDSNGDATIEEEVIPTPNWDDRFGNIGIRIPATYEVDIVPFDGAKVLHRIDSNSVFLRYSPDKDQRNWSKMLAFCHTTLKRIFGVEPQEIWYKETI